MQKILISKNTNPKEQLVVQDVNCHMVIVHDRIACDRFMEANLESVIYHNNWYLSIHGNLDIFGIEIWHESVITIGCEDIDSIS